MLSLPPPLSLLLEVGMGMRGDNRKISWKSDDWTEIWRLTRVYQRRMEWVGCGNDIQRPYFWRKHDNFKVLKKFSEAGEFWRKWFKGGWRRGQGTDNVGSIKDRIKKLGLYSSINKNPWEVFVFFLNKESYMVRFRFYNNSWWSLKNRFEAGKIGYGQTIEIAQERDYGSMDRQ